MIFVYLLLSLICSAANEMIEAKLKNRAKSLALGIRNLLGGNGLAERLYGHELISGLFSDKQGKPSYIPSRTFALALLNTIFPNNPALGQPGQPPNNAAQGGQAGQPDPNPLAALRATVAQLPANDPAAPIQQALLALIDDARGDINRLRKNIEDWYDAAMDRVSGWYKRRVQAIILLLGLVISIALNADSAYIARHLSTDTALRNSLVSAAQVYAQQENGAANQNGGQGENSGAPGGDQSAKDPAKTRFNKNIEQIKGLGLPIGWSVEANEAIDPHLKWPGLDVRKSTTRTEWGQQIRFHWLGWILTALAISLGAPFWFDMLNKFIVIRSTVKPKEKSPEEHSKD
jgi:hypothetical protein